jgi:hypothetical protein
MGGKGSGRGGGGIMLKTGEIAVFFTTMVKRGALWVHPVLPTLCSAVGSMRRNWRTYPRSANRHKTATAASNVAAVRAVTALPSDARPVVHGASQHVVRWLYTTLIPPGEGRHPSPPAGDLWQADLLL